jgi:DNA-binding response OmpR family regulator
MQPANSAAPPETPITPSPHPGAKVLCVEDEHFISELYARALTKAGYQIDVQADGPAALKMAQTDQYDIILLDLMVPNIDGIEILRRLRDPAQTPHLKAKIIIITNLEQRDDVRADIERQADGYVIKAEITPHELVDFLNNLAL